MRLRFLVPTLAVVLGLVQLAGGQERRPEGRGPGGPGGPPGGMMFGGGGGVSRLFLLRVPEIQKELELVDEQLTAIRKVQEELGRGGPGGPPGGGPEGQKGRGRGKADGKTGNEASLDRAVPVSWYFVQAQNPPGQPPEGRRSFGGGQPPSEEDRARFEQMRVERARQERTKLNEILLPHQMKRLTEIYIQQAGASALEDEEVATELSISADQKAALAKVRDENRQTMSAQMRELFQPGGDRDANRDKLAAMRKTADEKVFAVLTSEQKGKFDELKGKAFDLPEDALRNSFGGGRGGPPGGDNRGKRPEGKSN